MPYPGQAHHASFHPQEGTQHPFSSLSLKHDASRPPANVQSLQLLRLPPYTFAPQSYRSTRSRSIRPRVTRQGCSLKMSSIWAPTIFPRHNAPVLSLTATLIRRLFRLCLTLLQVRKRYETYRDLYLSLWKGSDELFQVLEAYLSDYEEEGRFQYANVVHGDPVFSNVVCCPPPVLHPGFLTLGKSAVCTPYHAAGSFYTIQGASSCWI